uniref:Uncharacterized protein n=1 Tax=Arundo donax TaxID=35708 RepID=A0A0A9EXQ8_ARUDO
MSACCTCTCSASNGAAPAAAAAWTSGHASSWKAPRKPSCAMGRVQSRGRSSSSAPGMYVCARASVCVPARGRRWREVRVVVRD